MPLHASDLVLRRRSAHRHVTRLAALLALVLAACASSDASATAETPEPTYGDAARALIDDAETRLDAFTPPADAPDDMRYGIVVTEDPDDYDPAWSILTGDGRVVLLGVAHGCDDDDDIYEWDLALLLDPGDLVRWVDDGDSKVCSTEVTVVEKAAA